MLLRTLRLLALCLLVVVAAASAGAQTTTVGALEIENPWIEVAVGRSGVAVAHLTLTNTADEGDRLYQASSPIAEAAELHRAEVEGELTLVRQVQTIDIPGGASVEFHPGGYHILLLGLEHPLKKGEKVFLTLSFMEAGTVEIEAEVGTIGWTPPHLRR